MTRPLRIQYDGAWYHVMNRGLNHQLVYYTDYHRQSFLELLADIHQRFNIQIHSYCLMGNHYHLLLHTPNGNLSRGMRHLDGLYTQRFNKKESRDGPLFRGRYKSILVDADSYLMQLSRYIHLNPVVANLVGQPEDYRWSSYRAYLEIVPCPEWLYCNEVLMLFSQNGSIQQYRNFIQQGVDWEMLETFSKNYLPCILGDESFITQVKNYRMVKVAVDPEIPNSRKLHKPSDLNNVLRLVMDYYGVEIADIKRRGHRFSNNLTRNLIIYFVSDYCGFSRQEISAAIGNVSCDGVSQAKKKVQGLMKSNPLLQKELEQLRLLVFSTS